MGPHGGIVNNNKKKQLLHQQPGVGSFRKSHTGQLTLVKSVEIIGHQTQSLRTGRGIQRQKSSARATEKSLDLLAGLDTLRLLSLEF